MGRFLVPRTGAPTQETVGPPRRGQAARDDRTAARSAPSSAREVGLGGPCPLRWSCGAAALVAASLTAISTGCREPTRRDSGAPSVDAAMDARSDAADGGHDASVGDATVWLGEGCHPSTGVECDGDWTGRCTPPCDRSECCSPQRGEFMCVTRGDGGACPAADIWFDASRMVNRYDFAWQRFEAADCALAERCVDGTGWRRLMHFATWTPNTGAADLYLGSPTEMSSLFEHSPCHDHDHFSTYVRFDLRDASGAVVARGHKQATCLLDTVTYPDAERRGGIYTCGNQGIQRGFQDVYFEGLPCQWLDVTGVAPGDYLLHVELNYERLLLESDYSNNTVDVPITIRPDDVTVACPSELRHGPTRNCGWERKGTFACTPGERLLVGCSTACGVGSCTGDAVLRVCDAAHDPGCDSGFMLAESDNSYCDGELCGAGGDCCPQVELDCPESGTIVVFAGDHVPGGPATCEVAIASPL